MKALARIFSALVLMACLVAAAALIWLRPPENLPPIAAIDRIVIQKAARRIVLFQNGKAMRSYPVALGRSPVGDKIRQGDNRTPEGVFASIARMQPRRFISHWGWITRNPPISRGRGRVAMIRAAIS